MDVTAEQCAQAEAERQRQAEMVPTRFIKVRRLGTTEQQLAGDPEAEGRTAFDRSASRTIGRCRCTTTGNSCRTRNHRHENWEAACVLMTRKHVGRLEFQVATLRVFG